MKPSPAGLHSIDRSEYPFTSRFCRIDGHNLHYIDEGSGDVILMLHGLPVWSFIYRHLITHLSRSHRCIALDHLGFGLSDKPSDADYTPAAHAQRLTRFIHSLELRNITLMVHDHGGPIGLSHAIEHPETVSRIALGNTWLWPINDDPHFRLLKFLSGRLGRLLYLQGNFSANVMLPRAFANRSRLTPTLNRHLRMMLRTPGDRVATYVLMREMLRSRDWFESLWKRRAAIVHKPTLVLWGMKDKFFPASSILAKWREILTQVRIVEIEHAGHFIQEEAYVEASVEIEEFMKRFG